VTPQPYDLTRFDPASFEHMVNLIALKVLGAGATGFGPGSDGGRDGYFEGEAAYPSDTDKWSGRWYIQSKFLRPHLSINPQKWLLSQISDEIHSFQDQNKRRTWPDNWIIATNIDPSGHPSTGSFDKARALVNKARPNLADRFHIWGGQKILHFLALHKEVSEYYSDYLMPGSIMQALYHHIADSQAGIRDIVRELVVQGFADQQFTRLEEAGSTTDTKPGIHRLFIDIPFVAAELANRGMAAASLMRSSAQNHKLDRSFPPDPEWRLWQRYPHRARVWFIRGGPGQGKSTLTQYVCQLNRAALILASDGPIVLPKQREIAEEVKKFAEQAEHWPAAPPDPCLHRA
jgi:hypothetical protein